MTKLNVFIRHGPTGIRGHIEVDAEATAEDIKRFLGNANVLMGWLADNKYESDASATPPTASDPDAPKCSECNQPMTHKAGTSKAGKKWGAWMCDNRDHSPVWDD